MKLPLSRLRFGLLDSALASLGMLAIGLYALSVFDAATLGVFAIFRSTFILAAVVPRQLLLLPAELSTLDDEAADRLGILTTSLRAGLVPALAAGVALPLATLLAGSVPSTTRWAFAGTAWLLAILSPLQDHLRRLAHLAGKSWLAAQASLVLVVVTAAALWLLNLSDLNRAMIPFGALAIGNLVSLATGWAVVRNISVQRAPSQTVRQMMRRGRWLVVIGAISPFTTFLSVAVVAALAGAEVLGFAEAARTVAQPVFIFGQGLAAVSNPLSMEAARRKDRPGAVSNARRYVMLLTGAALLYLVVFGLPWSANPMRGQFPLAFAMAGLLPLQIAANLANGAGAPFRAEVMGAGRDRRLAVAELTGNLVQVAFAFTALAIGAYARPGGDLASGVVLVLVYWLANRGHYRSDR